MKTTCQHYLKTALKRTFGLMSVCAALLPSGCNKPDISQPLDKDALLQYGDSILTVTDVTRDIPAGLDRADSIALSNAIIRSWLEERLLEEIAEENLGDDDKIERMVSDYRRRLLISEYRKRMRAKAASTIPEDSVKRFFNAHCDEYLLPHPIVKGLYIKLPSNSTQLNNVRLWMREPSEQNLDRLEKYAYKEAIQYDYFMDTWQDWDLLRSQIPYHFPDGDKFVASTKDFETTYMGSTYLVHISDHLASGKPMPYEIAAIEIKKGMEQAMKNQSEEAIFTSLIDKALKSGKLKTNKKIEQK